jgi:hypothetical protein
MRPPRRIAALTAALLVLAALCSGFAMAAAPGVVVNGPSAFTGVGSNLLAGLGVPWLRSFVSWSELEPSRRRLDRNSLAGLEAQLAGYPRKAKVVLDVVDSPQWASGSAVPTAPPRNPADYGAFVGRLAKRMGRRVAAYEIWNEEDDAAWWAGGPDPARYAALLRDAHAAIKAANRHAIVVLGGLTGNDYEFLSQLYSRGAKGTFDAVGVHTDTLCDVISPYSVLRNRVRGHHLDLRISRWSFLGYRTVREVMLAHGDRKPIWMTELGWSTYPGVCDGGRWAGQKAGGVGPSQQAAFLLQAYHCLALDRYVQVAIWYGLLDTGPAGGPRGQYGLLDPTLTPKPAYGALADYAHHGDRLSGACGVARPRASRTHRRASHTGRAHRARRRRRRHHRRLRR